MSVKILDCTLRDGGYINNWEFDILKFQEIIKSLELANIDIIEIGYLTYKHKDNTTLFNNIKSLKNLLNIKNKVIMINHGDFDIKNIPYNDEYIDGIRLAFHKKDKDKVLNDIKILIEKQYNVYIQPMIIKNYSDKEYLELIEQINKLDIKAFYIVDSFGNLTLEEFKKYIYLSDFNLRKNISLGYHSHNNMQLAFSNAIYMCKENLQREIIIDASIYGMGRGAGNLNTELICNYLNNEYNNNYITSYLLEIIDRYLNFLMSKNRWGFSLAQYLSAFFNCHPNYASYLINKNTTHITTIKEILSRIEKTKKSSFDKIYIEKLYNNYILEPKSIINDNEFLFKNKFLMIASGKSVNKHINLINQKKDYLKIGLNHIPNNIEIDIIFFTNQKRFDEFYNDEYKLKIVITNNIKTDKKVKSIIDFKKYATINKKIFTNVAIVFLNYLIDKNIKEVKIAGLDGYIIDKNNYSYNETSVILDKESLINENQMLSNALRLLKDKIDITLITPSIFRKDIGLKILGVIPARYRSSRFEGKPLCVISGIPMIKRTYNQAKRSHLLTHLVVATDDYKIKAFCEKENIPVIMTNENCITGTDRLAEVAQSYNYDLYVNIQGDEPVIDAKSIDEVVEEYLRYEDKYIAYNLYKIIEDKEEIESSTIIKVIVNEKDELLYMSRYAIPFSKSKKSPFYKKQVCVYGFTQDALKLFSSRKEKTLNEEYEDIEILRFLDMGYKVKMKETKVDSIAVDIPEDIKKVENFLEQKGLK